MNAIKILFSLSLCLARCFALDLATLRAVDLPKDGELQAIIEFARESWRFEKFEGEGIDGIICWRSVGNGITTTQVAIYARSRNEKVWKLRLYQEMRLRKVNVAVNNQSIKIKTVGDLPVAEFFIKFLDSYDAN